MSNEVLRNYVTEDLAYEGFLTVLFSCLSKNYRAVVDVGAASGYYVGIAVSRMREGVIYCYEPSPKRYDYLLSIVKDFCGDVSIVTRDIGIGDIKCEKDFIFHSDEKLSGCIADTPDPGEHIKGDKRIRIRIDTLDNLHPSEWVDAVKIDTEGYELHVLRGAKGLIERCHPDFFIEYHSFGSVGIAEVLKPYGYRGIDFGNGRAFFTVYNRVF